MKTVKLLPLCKTQVPALAAVTALPRTLILNHTTRVPTYVGPTMAALHTGVRITSDITAVATAFQVTKE